MTMKNIKEKLELSITDLDMQGLGIAHLNEKTYFVENAITGEKVQAKIIKEKKNIVNAKSIKIIKESEDRVTPLCPYFNECGGCDLQHINYEKTLEFKKHQIKLLLKKIANIKYDKDIEIIKSDKEYFYRNKLSMHLQNENNIAKLCYYKKHSHNGVFIKNCYIVDKKFEIVIKLVNEFFKENNIKAFDNKNKTGFAKHIVARIIKNKLLLTFVLNKNDFPSVEKLYNYLSQHFEEVGLNLNINKKHNEILSNDFIHLKGIKYIEFKLFDIIQKINNASFLQVNTYIQNKLYEFVLENIDNVVVNAYSGAGLLTALMTKKLESDNKLNFNNKVFGIEINKEATILADKLMTENNIKNVENICADANTKLKELNISNYTLVLDPPKNGINEQMIKTILEQKPNKIIYISCSLNSLCKNLKDLIKNYDIEGIKGFDMFPQTKNLETVVILKKRD